MTYSSVDSLKSFNNLYEITNRKLGAGATSEVFMAIDIWHRCQVACKIVNLIKPAENPVEEQQPGIVLNTAWQTRLWREVELLKHISHVRHRKLSRILLTSRTAKYHHGQAGLSFGT